MAKTRLKVLDPLIYAPVEDMLHKESQFLEPFYRLITESVDPPFAISIDGLWGTGKTTAMRLLQDKLQLRGYPVFWFNPWKYSQTQDVVLAFLQSLASAHKDRLREMQKSGGQMFQVLLHIGMGTALKVFTQGQVSLNDVKEAFKEVEKDVPWENYQDMIVKIEAEFADLVNIISKHHDNKPLIIFFDDLDRCLPDNAIQLLEALKNLFVTPACQSIFICGIDTRVAKNFIQKHYDVAETFAINYFRKIFNLTVSMPYSAKLESLLLKHIQELYSWDDPDGNKAERLAAKVASLGKQAEIASVRNYLNVIHNVYAFQQFNPDYHFDPAEDEDFVLCILIVKEAWQPLYEQMIQSSLQREQPNMATMVNGLKALLPVQADFLAKYFGENAPFGGKSLATELTHYPTLA